MSIRRRGLLGGLSVVPPADGPSEPCAGECEPLRDEGDCTRRAANNGANQSPAQLREAAEEGDGRRPRRGGRGGAWRGREKYIYIYILLQLIKQTNIAGGGMWTLSGFIVSRPARGLAARRSQGGGGQGERSRPISVSRAKKRPRPAENEYAFGAACSSGA